MLTNPEGPFINLSRLNLAKYSQKPSLSRVRRSTFLQHFIRMFFSYQSNDQHFLLQTLFEYIFHHENDVKNVSFAFTCAVMKAGWHYTFCFWVDIFCTGFRFGCSGHWACTVQRLVVESSTGKMLLQVSNSQLSMLICSVALLADFCFFSCLLRLGLYREAEKQFRSALNHQEVVDTYLYLAKVLTELSQRYIILPTRCTFKIYCIEESCLCILKGLSAPGSTSNGPESFQARPGPLPWWSHASNRNRPHPWGKVRQHGALSICCQELLSKWET